MPSTSPTVSLTELLHRVFGHREFRAQQETVCAAATDGRDVLLVMPTGAGKSLCYQLPALARGGTALVISPLIALMDDQATRLASLGLNVARIHSGLSREDSRQACRDYLDGKLQFLFIAPERMRVPGFPEMLARRKPALVAIDEAHCISQWGHDFRPDYRTLGQHLPALRPAPIVALTATATPTVQKDIAHQLQLREPAIFITGFRRSNLAIEVAEMSKPQRPAFTAKLLADKGARPAIVYAPSRKAAEELATRLNTQFPARAYHAGLESSVRERVQRDFLAGKLEVVVATVAFGMGVDKADVRTVVHVALPGSVEAFYQEIGRAGRDGLPSRTVLLHNFADRKLQEFFLERSYPPAADLERVAAALTTEFVPLESIQKRLKMDLESLERVLDKLIGHGVATMDFAGSVRATGEQSWQSGYDSQVTFRRREIERMVAFAEGQGCRMAALVAHFGDRADAGRPCGHCDICNPSGTAASLARTPDEQDRKHLRSVLRALEAGSRSTGKLFTETAVTKDRQAFDTLLDGLARAGLVSLSTDTFRAEDGRDISYRKAALTPDGRSADDRALATVYLRGGVAETKSKSRSRQKSPSSSVSPKSLKPEKASLNPKQAKIADRLREWRLEEARTKGVSAFVILHNSTLEAIAAAAPQTLADLGEVSGMAPSKVDRFGEGILRVCTLTNASHTSILSPGITVAAAPNHEVKPAVSAVVMRPRTQPAAQDVRATELTDAQKLLDAKLREWRREEATRAGLPTFFIFSDTVLSRLVQTSPQSLSELGAIRGLEPAKLDRFGPAILALCRA